MKLIRFGKAGLEKPGVELADGTRIDVSKCADDFDEDFFADGGIAKLKAWLKKNEKRAPRVSRKVRLGSPIARPSKIVCVGLNYSDHARESKMEPPKEPVLFMKATTALVGPNDPVVMPRGSKKTDWEVELAIVIGKRTSYVTRDNATKYIAGYCLHNDYSEREYQLERCGQWDKGKGCDTFAPLGPWLVTRDEVSNVGNLRLWLNVNGEKKQDGNTSNLIFDVPFLVSYISQFMTLLSGDVISTGTPAGVGLGFNPPQYLKAGDVVELGIDGLGVQRQIVKASK
jgi:2-keto-4-pentenoate hydratase/2-oxohepta-3-ene-1,7-dioic acid hydratase in catechol pathway